MFGRPKTKDSKNTPFLAQGSNSETLGLIRSGESSIPYPSLPMDCETSPFQGTAALRGALSGGGVAHNKSSWRTTAIQRRDPCVWMWVVEGRIWIV